MFIDRSKFCEHFWKGSPWNISMKLSQNLTNAFREDFSRICSYPYSESSPHSLEPCLMMDQNLTNNFWKGSPKEHFFKIISKSDKQIWRRRFFKNFIMSVQCKKPPFIRAMFMDGSKFLDQFLRRVTYGTFLRHYFKIGSAISKKKIFKNFFMPV